MVRRWRVFGAVVSLLLGVATMTVASGHALAAGQAISLTTSPVTLNLTIKPGEKTTENLQLKNNSTVPVQITMKLETFGPSGTSGEAAITAPSANDPSATWVTFSPASFVANPGVMNTVKMTIALPQSASLGYYYAVVFQPSVATQVGPGTTSVKGSNAILVLVDTQSSNESRQINVASFTASKRVYEYLPATFSVNIRNSGNIYLAPTGSIFISRGKNSTHTLTTLNLNAGGGNVLPHSNRVFTVSWNDGFPVYEPKMANGQPVVDKKGNVEQKLVWNLKNISNFRFGEYTAQLTLVYTAQNRVIPVTGYVSFWVIPWELLLIGLVIVLLIGFGLWMIIRGIVRRILKFRNRKNG